MQVRDAPAPRGAGAVMVNRAANGWPAGANDLRGRAVKVGEAHPIDPLQCAEDAVAAWSHVRRRDTHERTPGDHEDDREVAQPWNCTAGDLRERVS